MTFKKNQPDAEIKTELRKTPLGQLLDDDELDMLISQSTWLRFSPGETLIQQGKKSQGMYIVISGTALVSAKILGEGGTYIATLGPGNLAGEVSLINKEPSSTSVLASSPVQCLLITDAYFEILALLFPQTKYKIMKAITKEVAHRLKDLLNKITNSILQSDMISRSMFSEVIQSLTKPSIIDFAEAEITAKDLQKSDLFADFTHEELEVLLKNMTAIKAAKNCILIQAGEKNPHCYITLRGAVQSSIVGNNKMAKLSVIGPLCFITGIFTIENTLTSILNYTTCEHSILLQLSTAELKRLQTEHVMIWYKIFELICRALTMLERSAEKLDVRLNSELYNR